ncbi:MAG: ABC transporter ATP-binding protein/permease [Eubacterium sp.]|nr:ABC transporter ATP-binding protein/permease [Eubacterium sp.]
MLKCLKYFTSDGIKTVVKASIGLTIFQIACIAPMILIVRAFSQMLDAYRAGQIGDFNLGLYIIVGTLLVLLMYVCYRKMYKLKYFGLSNENMNLRMGVMDKLRRLPESYLSKHDLSDLTSRVMDDIGTIEGVLANQLTEMFGGILSIALVILFMFFVNVKMTLALMVVLPVVVLSMSLSDVVSGRTHMKNRLARVAISDGIQEYLENIKVLKISGSIETYQKGLFRKIRKLIPGLVLFEFLAGMCVSTAYNMLRMGIGVVAIYGVNLLIKGQIDVETYITFVLMAVWIYEPLSYTCENLGAVIASKVAATRIEEIMEYKEQEGQRDIVFNDYDISFDDVRFSYETKEEILKGVSFTANQGQYTALVGPSGSGKSTICKLAARLWDVDSGSLTLGGKEVSDISPETLFKQYSIVFQDVTLFNDSIYNNILIGNKDASREDVLRAAEYAQCMPFIEKLPQGIDTIIGENGHTLSGGERQRLSIARAFLKDAPIVLLDESTASIDPETETRIQAAIEKLTKGKTVLMIAHRLRSIVGCDRIVVLDQGKVVGDGRHEELMNNCPVYKKLYTLQHESEETI